jgi:hypothetical protein
VFFYFIMYLTDKGICNMNELILPNIEYIEQHKRQRFRVESSHGAFLFHAKVKDSILEYDIYTLFLNSLPKSM